MSTTVTTHNPRPRRRRPDAKPHAADRAEAIIKAREAGLGRAD
ncbi:MAG: hypothetical protein JWR27_769 [Aeromicrobium sp.]|nr:hypothetical protein [Aeromicrobium sp.]